MYWELSHIFVYCSLEFLNSVYWVLREQYASSNDDEPCRGELRDWQDVV